MRQGSRRRALALYLTTVFLSVTCAGLAFTMLATQRADRRVQANIDVDSQAWWCARAGIEIGLAFTEQFSDWRQKVTGNVMLADVPVGDGTVTVQVYDDRDSNLTNDETQPVRMVATATCDGSTTRLQANLSPRPHPALRFCCFGTTNNDMEFKGSSDVKGPVRSQGNILSSAATTMHDDASFETVTGYTIAATLSPKCYKNSVISAPSVNLSTYLAMATPISGSLGATCQLKKYNLTSTSNSEGAPNARGIYSLDPIDRDVVIENTHIRGTLIIYNAPNRKVTFQQALWVEPGSLNYPVILIDNPNANTKFAPNSVTLTELTSLVDFNEDGDLLDLFPTSLRGIVWASSSPLDVQGNNWTVTGCVIGPHLDVDNNVVVDNDAQLQNSLCPGFLGTGMRLEGGNYLDIR